MVYLVRKNLTWHNRWALAVMGEAVECETLNHEIYDVAGQLKAFVDEGGDLLACGTCPFP